jgi:hypothetical protein
MALIYTYVAAEYGFLRKEEINGVASLPPVVFLDRSEPVEEAFSLAVLLGYCKKRQIHVLLSVFLFSYEIFASLCIAPWIDSTLLDYPPFFGTLFDDPRLFPRLVDGVTVN